MPQQTAAGAAECAPPMPQCIHPDDLPDLYALTGTGTCMEPLIPDGACCAFDKRVKPAAGDLVGMIFTHEAAMARRIPGWIKRLVMPRLTSRGDFIVVEQLNPAIVYAIPVTDVAAVHKFIGTADDLGNGQAAIHQAFQVGEAA